MQHLEPRHLFTIALALCLTANLTFAINWDNGGTTDEWTEAANWAGDVLPGPSDQARIHVGNDADFNSAGTEQIGTLRLGSAFAGSTGTLDVQSGTLKVNDATSYTDSNGTLLISGGTLDMSGNEMELGRRAGDFDSITVQGGTLLAGFALGNDGSHSFTVTSGQATFTGSIVSFAADPDAGDSDPDTSTVIVTGGTMSVAGTLCIGCSVATPLATLQQTGGVIQAGDMLTGTNDLGGGALSVVISGGDLNLVGALDLRGQVTFEVIGTDPSIQVGGNVRTENNTITNEMKFTFNVDGVSPIETAGRLITNSNETLTIDASAYNPDNGLTVTLVDYAVTRIGLFETVNVTPPGCYSASVDQGGPGDDEMSVTFTFTGDCAALETAAAELLCTALQANLPTSFDELEVLAGQAADDAFTAAGCAPNAVCKAQIVSNLTTP